MSITLEIAIVVSVNNNDKATWVFELIETVTEVEYKNIVITLIIDYRFTMLATVYEYNYEIL